MEADHFRLRFLDHGAGRRVERVAPRPLADGSGIDTELGVVRAQTLLPRRLAGGILGHLGVDEMVATGDAEYVAQAERLARDAAHWGAMHEALASRRPRLYGDVSSVRALEAFFERALSPA